MTKRRKHLTALATALLFATFPMTAQETPDNGRSHGVYLELLGASNGVGVNYDARFKKESPWGWRAGFGFGYAQSNIFLFGAHSSIRAYSVPLEVNYLTGKHRSHFEMGVGVNLGMYNIHDDYSIINRYEDAESGGYKYEQSDYHTKENKFGSFLYLNLGYRYVSQKGFLFRVGATTATSTNSSFLNSVAIMPYVGFGWTF